MRSVGMTGWVGTRRVMVWLAGRIKVNQRQGDERHA
jgi:hypothetical protein